jgi:hypothetical protein
MGDALSELGLLGKVVVNVDRVMIAGQIGKSVDELVIHELGISALLAYGKGRNCGG